MINVSKSNLIQINKSKSKISNFIRNFNVELASILCIISCLSVGFLYKIPDQNPQALRMFLEEPMLTTFFKDDFERDDPLSDIWTLGINTKKQLIYLSSNPFGIGKVLKIQSQDSETNNQFITLTMPIAQKNAIFSIKFYDSKNNSSEGTFVKIRDSNGNYATLKIVANSSKYIYRINKTDLNTFDRTSGWHRLSFQIINGILSTKLDEKLIDSKGLVSNVKNIAYFDLGKTVEKSGQAYFDDFTIDSLNPIPTNTQTLLDNWTNEVYRIYQNTNLQPLMDKIKREKKENGGGAIRPFVGQAMMHIYKYQLTKNQNDLNKAIRYMNFVADTHNLWYGVWTSGTNAYMLGFDAWWVWSSLDQNTQIKIANILIKEADYWTWVLNEIKTNPNGSTIPEKSGRRSGKTNLSLMTSPINSMEHLTDSRAEENGWNAQFLALVYNMFPNHPNANKWGEAAKCFAFHTVSKGETYCGITTRTVSDDGTLGNHNLWPNPNYAISAITNLQQGQLYYLLAGKKFPSEFNHGIESLTKSSIYKANIANCTDSLFQIKPICHKGKDWGESDMFYNTLTLGLWGELSHDTESTNLVQKNLKFYYGIRKDIIRYPQSAPVSSISDFNLNSGPGLEWLKNIEFHPRISSRIYTAASIDNFDHQQNFPQNIVLSTNCPLINRCSNTYEKQWVSYMNTNYPNCTTKPTQDCASDCTQGSNSCVCRQTKSCCTINLGIQGQDCNISTPTNVPIVTPISTSTPSPTSMSTPIPNPGSNIVERCSTSIDKQWVSYIPNPTDPNKPNTSTTCSNSCTSSTGCPNTTTCRQGTDSCICRVYLSCCKKSMTEAEKTACVSPF
ncbi:hypothetical protein GYA19_03625 [Candidatus Beckwithbacteria bacterium]|nr:hypothetical protein [Candidatus Beckwithbacteria bacterium]